MKNICLYPHPTSLNHGCEAIAVCTSEILKRSIPKSNISLGVMHELQTDGIETQLVKKSVDQLVLCSLPDLKRLSIEWFKYQLIKKIRNKDCAVEILANRFYKDNNRLINSNELFLSIGGDNYCYGRPTGLYAIHKVIANNEKKSMLYGCSIEPNAIDKEMIEDLKLYNLIVCRESITYEALKDRGLTNAVLYPDPAFTLTKSEESTIKLPVNTIGINVSPMILDYSSESQTVYTAFLNLLKYLIDNTAYNIALIPHVTVSTTDDRMVLKKLYEDLDKNRRIQLFDDMDCKELKNIISQCRFFIGARTHATIAAYSTCVPTLVCGYSVKAKGIAKDLFGSYENYVIPVQTINNEKQLIDAFLWMEKNEESIRDRLETIMPDYIDKAYEAGKVILNEL